jgi:uncharacterized pyridoxamine 5'-phosphate oxidase family protein
MDLVCYEPVGCEACNNAGYKGRVGLYEAILTDDRIAKVMAQTPTPTEREIKKAAEHQKILTMIEDGVVKILNGDTSYDEVNEVVDLTEDIQELLQEVHSVTTQEEVVPEEKNSSVQMLHETVHSPIEITPAPVNHEPLDLSHYATAGEEIILLVDYLKLLEEHQQSQPTVGIADKIARVQHMIIALLENNPHLENIFVTSDPQVLVHDQIEKLMQELKSLEQEQLEQPEIGIADKIAGIRNTIQSMRGEVVSH